MTSLDIVDAFDVSDKELLSVVGKKSYKDSDEMYQNLMDVVRKNPINQQPIAKGFNRYIRPILDGKLWAEGWKYSLLQSIPHPIPLLSFVFMEIKNCIANLTLYLFSLTKSSPNVYI